jgi:hypothetical protein
VAPSVAAPAAAPPAAPKVTAVAPSPPAPPAPEPAIRHPLQPDEAGGALPPLDRADAYVNNLLFDLAGRRAVQTFLSHEGFVRRFVATVDNLGRDHAPSSAWPAVPAPGRFEVETRGAGAVIAAPNARRYAPFVAFAAGIDSRRVVGLYRRLYPLLQQAYEDLGYPGKYFNDRVVAVIDDLLATPDLPEPIKVKVVETPGARPGKASGGLYLFEDPSLESRTAGQKLLLRMGHANAVKVKAKLTEIRRQIATGFSTSLDK